jgi:hypothetical protein
MYNCQSHNLCLFQVVGLHENADITLGKNECEYLLNTVSNTRPKEAGGNAGGKSREDMVFEKCDELLHKLEGCMLFSSQALFIYCY